MSKKLNPPRSTTPVNAQAGRQLADLATLLGLMQSASKLSAELDALANQVGGSLETIAERFGVPFFAIHQAYVDAASKKPKVARRTGSRRQAKAKA